MPRPTAAEIREQYARVEHALHVLWSRATRNPDYVKKEWQDLQQEILRLGVLRRDAVGDDEPMHLYRDPHGE